MRIRMLTRAAAPEQGRVYQPGQEVLVPDEVAVAWLNGGYAEPVDGPKVEEAVRKVPERAVTAVRGIGPATGAKLRKIGIESVPDLVSADLIAVAAATGASDEQVLRWQVVAAEM